MKALELLKEDRDFCLTINNDKSIIQKYDEVIEEIEDLKNSNNELLKGLKSTQKRLEEWLEK